MYLTEPLRIAEMDAYAEKTLGISVRELMGRAGEALALETARRLSPGARILVLVGPGNNGGDGYAAALILAERGFSVRICAVLGGEQKSEAGRYYAGLARKKLGEPLALDALTNEEINDSDAVIDAIFGTGARFMLPYEIMMLMTRIAGAPARILRVAADAPTGIDGDTGRANRMSFRADLTVTFVLGKRGMYSYPARDYCGEIVIADIGLPQKQLAEVFPASGLLLDAELAASLLPMRPKNTHKGSFGRLLVLAGSQRYRGAAALVTAAALRAGAGSVMLASHPSVLDLALTRTPELLTLPIAEPDKLDRDGQKAVYAAAERAGAILVGCGSGTSAALGGMLWEMLSTEGAPLVLDADALNSLALHREESLHRLRKAKRSVVLTPHPLELARLMGKTAEDIQAERIASAEAFSEQTGATVVLKGAGTVIASPGALVTLNSTGGSALAKAGSGDVLAGILGAFLAEGTEPYAAAALAVYLHGAAGDTLAARLSNFGVMPSDLPIAVAEVLRGLEQQRR